jgi:hypothetical protein
MSKGKYPRTKAFRQEQSVARKHSAAVAKFYAALGADTADEAERQHLLVDLARQCVVTSPSGAEHVRWELYLNAAERGSVIGVMVVPIKVSQEPEGQE